MTLKAVQLKFHTCFEKTLSLSRSCRLSFICQNSCFSKFSANRQTKVKLVMSCYDLHLSLGELRERVSCFAISPSFIFETRSCQHTMQIEVPIADIYLASNNAPHRESHRLYRRFAYCWNRKFSVPLLPLFRRGERLFSPSMRLSSFQEEARSGGEYSIISHSVVDVNQTTTHTFTLAFRQNWSMIFQKSDI